MRGRLSGKEVGQCGGNAFDVEVAEVVEYVDGAVLYEAVGQAEAYDVRAVAVVAHPLHDGRTGSALACSVLDGEYGASAAGYLGEQVVVEGLDEA